MSAATLTTTDARPRVEPRTKHRAYYALAAILMALAVVFVSADDAHAQTVPYTEVDAAIDDVGLPYDFHYIAQRESNDIPTAVNDWSGACGPFQMLPSVAWGMQYVPTSSRFNTGYGYTCAELTDPNVAAQAALELYNYLGYQPWGL